MEIITQPAVYVIEHEATGKIYIGSTGDIAQRKRAHRSDLSRGVARNKPLQDVFNSDSTIEFTVLPVATKEEAIAYEQKLLDQYKDSGLLLNVALDARASGKGLIRSEETRDRISEAGMGRTAFNKGKPLSEQHHSSLIESRKALSKAVVVDGQTYPSLNEAARQTGFSLGCIAKRISSKSESFTNYSYV